MPSMFVPYSLLVVSVLCFINYFISLYWTKECFRVKYGYGCFRASFANFQKQYRIAKGSGNSEYVRQVRLKHSDLFGRYLVAKLSFILGLLMFIPGLIWTAEVKFSQGLATSAAIFGVLVLSLAIFSAISYRRANRAFIYPGRQAKRAERRIYKLFLAAAIKEDDYLKILRRKAEQAEFLFYDDFWENSATAACLALIPFIATLVLAIKH